MSYIERQVDAVDEATRAAGLYLVHLVAVGLHTAQRGAGRTTSSPVACPLPENTTWGRVYALARSNSVEGLSWFGASTRDDVPDDVRKRWSADADMTLWRRLQFDAERERVLAAVTAAGFSVLPLKGVLMAGYYPDPAMRSMADNDILYGRVEAIPAGDADALQTDEVPGGALAEGFGSHGFRIAGATERDRERTVVASTAELTRIMDGLGYRASHTEVGNADCYEKAPCFNFEMHRILAEARLSFSDYYRNPWLRARRDAPDSLHFHFADEDEYLYHIAHAFKHYNSGGCGIRLLADEAVFLTAKSERMDWDYIARELDKLGMTDFEARVHAVADSLLRGDPAAVFDADRDTCEFLLFLLSSGVYGNRSTRIAHRLEEFGAQDDGSALAHLRYLWWRVRLDDETLAQAHPWLTRHHVPLPIVLCYRMVRGLTMRFPAIFDEFRAIMRS